MKVLSYYNFLTVARNPHIQVVNIYLIQQIFWQKPLSHKTRPEIDFLSLKQKWRSQIRK